MTSLVFSFAVVLAAAPAVAESDVARVASWLSGSFSSAGQAAADPDYRDVRLHVAPIWGERSDGPWLYVEQALGTMPDKPYRQRVYRVVGEDDGSIRSDIYALPGELGRYVGAWREARLPVDVTPQTLTRLEGCSVFLERKGDSLYEGGTRGRGCAGTRDGAAYTTSEVLLTRAALRSWDRGFDAEGRQAWGADKGPYVFRRD